MRYNIIMTIFLVVYIYILNMRYNYDNFQQFNFIYIYIYILNMRYNIIRFITLY